MGGLQPFVEKSVFMKYKSLRLVPVVKLICLFLWLKKNEQNGKKISLLCGRLIAGVNPVQCLSLDSTITLMSDTVSFPANCKAWVSLPRTNNCIVFWIKVKLRQYEQLSGKSIEAPNMNKVSLIYWQNINDNCNLYIKNSLMMLKVLHKVLKCTQLSLYTYTCFVQSQMAATKGSGNARAYWIYIDASNYPKKPQKAKIELLKEGFFCTKKIWLH